MNFDLHIKLTAEEWGDLEYALEDSLEDMGDRIGQRLAVLLDRLRAALREVP